MNNMKSILLLHGFELSSDQKESEGKTNTFLVEY